MVDLSQLSHAQLELDHVFHMHDEGKLLQELRCLVSTFDIGQIAIVKGREPIHEPELDHEDAVDLLIDFRVELLLALRTETIYGSHLGELDPILHVLEGALEQRIDSCKQKHDGTVLAAPQTDIIPKLAPSSSDQFGIGA